jgi:O-antigen/teichoic acid export membrane protein
LPVLTRYLTTKDYGIVSMFFLLASVVGVFVGVNVHGAIQREYFNKDRINFKEYVANCLIILVVTSLITTIFIYLFSSFIEKVSGVPFNLFWCVLLLSFYQFVFMSLLVIYQAQMNAFIYSMFQISLTMINVLLSLLFVVSFKWGYLGRVYGQFFAYFILGNICLLILLLKYSEFKLNFDYIKRALNFGIPLIPHTLGGILIAMIGRFIVNINLGLEQTGIYTVGLQIGMIIEILASSFNKAYSPWLFDKLNKNDFIIKLKIVKFTYLYFVAIILISILLGYIAPYLLKVLVGKEFQKSSNLILWIALGNAFSGMYYMVTNYIFYTYKTYLLSVITFFCGLLNILITYILIKYLKLIGAAQAFMIANFMLFILTWYLSSKVYKMPWRFQKV